MASTPAEHMQVCPKCGHCPTCGRSNHPPNGFYPWWPSDQYPYYWPYTYPAPTITWTSTTTPVTSTAATFLANSNLPETLTNVGGLA